MTNELSSCTTGVNIDFHTNSGVLKLSTRSKGKYEVYIDGLLAKQFILNEDDVGKELTVKLIDPIGCKKDDYRVTVYLPSHTAGTISYIEIDDGAYVKAHEYSFDLLMVGDSITQGWNANYDSFSYANCVSRFFNARTLNQGIGGGVFDVSTLDDLSFEPDVVTVAYGTNDFSRYPTYDVLRKYVSEFLDELIRRYGDKRIFIISPIWRELREKPMGTFEGCRKVIIEEITKRGLIHIDGLTLISGVKELFPDGLHPNSLGFSVYALNLCRELARYIWE